MDVNDKPLGEFAREAALLGLLDIVRTASDGYVKTSEPSYAKVANDTAMAMSYLLPEQPAE